MNGAVGDTLPLAVAVAISPIPIIAVILMLLAPRAARQGGAFLAGWVTGVVVVSIVVIVLAGLVGLTDTGGGTANGVVKLVLGAGLFALALRQWRSRPRGAAEPAPPRWMGAIDTMTAAKACGLGFLLSGLNPKNLMMILAAGITIGAAGLAAGQAAVVVAIFTVLSSSTVAAPVLVCLFAERRARVWLGRLRTWLVAHNAAVMIALLLLIGTVLVGKGLASL